MTETVILDDDLGARARAQAGRAYGGRLDLLVADAVSRHLQVEASAHRLHELTAAQPGSSETERIAQAVALDGRSRQQLEAVANILLQVSGHDPGGRDADSPQEHVRRLLKHVDGSSSRAVTCTLVTTQPSSGPDGQQRDAVTSFARGTLRGRAPGLAGDVQQYFSDRTSGPFAAPFDPARGERLGVQIALDPLSRLVTLELIAHAWGGARQTLTDLRVASGVLVGRGASIGNLTASALYAFSLGTIVVPV